MNEFSRAKAEALAKAVAADPDGYIEQYRSNSHFNFGDDDPYQYYMPKDNEQKWLALQNFEWNMANSNCSMDTLEQYISQLQVAEASLGPKLKPHAGAIRAALKASLANPDVVEQFCSAIKGSIPADVLEADEPELTAKALSGIIDKEDPAALSIALLWGSYPQLFSQFFINSDASLDKFVKDNEAVMTAVSEAQVKMTASAAALDKAVVGAAGAIEKAAGKGGVADFILNHGLAAAQRTVLPNTASHWATGVFDQLAEDLKSRNSFLGYVNCKAAATFVNKDGLGRQLYDQISYGPRGSTLNLVAQAAVVDGFQEALTEQVVGFMMDGGAKRAAVEAVVKKMGSKEAEAFNDARTSLDSAWAGIKLDYALADLASLEIQYKY